MYIMILAWKLSIQRLLSWYNLFRIFLRRHEILQRAFLRTYFKHLVTKYPKLNCFPVLYALDSSVFFIHLNTDITFNKLLYWKRVSIAAILLEQFHGTRYRRMQIEWFKFFYQRASDLFQNNFLCKMIKFINRRPTFKKLL
jgi:hypothetical protein